MISIGIDTGGTYTDAVLFHRHDGVIAKSKSPTTREDLSIGITTVMDAVLANRPQGKPIELVSLSTTLATNAIVEGHGGRVCLILIGPLSQALSRSKLKEAMGSDPVVRVEGGHSAQGEELAQLDELAIEEAVREFDAGVHAYALVSHFATRNAQHEARARALIRALTDKPITCSVDLSAKLDAPRRALTCVLNGRLIPLIVDLIRAVDKVLQQNEIDAPLMIMQGDGSLLRADRAILAPVETILSGPAASIVGAAHIANKGDAVISDIGGTTTDIAILRNGVPQRNPNGCVVAGWHTMVEAVQVYTYGLGGDSEVTIHNHNQLLLGPQRVIPLSMLGHQYPQVRQLLQQQLERSPRELDGRFALQYRLMPAEFNLTPRERLLWDRLQDGPVSVDDLLENAALERPLERLRKMGWVAISALTPTDAAQYLDLHDQWDGSSAEAALQLYLRRFVQQQTALGQFARSIVDKLIELSATRVFEASWQDDNSAPVAVADNLLQRAFGHHESAGVTRIDLGLSMPLIGVGAPARAYYEEVAKKLNTDALIPRNFDVCNAIGAVSSGIIRRREALICLVGDQVYRLHLRELVQQSEDLSALEKMARTHLTDMVQQDVRDNGAGVGDVTFNVTESTMTSETGDQKVIERRIVAIATASPV